MDGGQVHIFLLIDPFAQEKIDFDTVLEGVKNRDFKDSTRDVSPLKKSPDAILLDTTEKSVEDVVCLIIELIQKMRSVN